MIHFSLFINLLLSVLGVLLLTALVRGGKDGMPIRLLFFAYFAVVLQYNYERVLVFPNYFVLMTAALSLVCWSLQPMPEIE